MSDLIGTCRVCGCTEHNCGKCVARTGRPCYWVTADLCSACFGMNPAELEAASDEWGCNCGPSALCAVLGRTPAELRPHLRDFEQKRYTNPTLMGAILLELGIRYRPIYRSENEPVAGGVKYPQWGLIRIQWSGPWTKPGVPMAARYRKTHWIAHRFTHDGNRQVFDVNAVNAPTEAYLGCDGWISWELWKDKLVPWLMPLAAPKGDGRWWPTHCWELQP